MEIKKLKVTEIPKRDTKKTLCIFVIIRVSNGEVIKYICYFKQNILYIIAFVDCLSKFTVNLISTPSESNFYFFFKFLTFTVLSNKLFRAKLEKLQSKLIIVLSINDSTLS